MKRLLSIFQKARGSRFYLFLLNQILLRRIPFNGAHGLKITAVGENDVTVFLPCRRSNQNHLKGIHACALATLAEYASGIVLMKSTGAEYRLIMKTLSVTYHFQAKEGVRARVGLDPAIVDEKIRVPLAHADAVLFENQADVYDLSGNHICTAIVNWQIKKWDKVRTR